MKNTLKILSIIAVAITLFSFGVSSKGGVNSRAVNGPDTIPYNKQLSSYGYVMQRLLLDSGLVIPNTDTSFGTDVPRQGSLVYRTVGGDNTLYLYSGRWVRVGTAGQVQVLSKNARGDSIILSGGGGQVQDRDTQQLSLVTGASAGDTLKLDRSVSIILNYLNRSHFIDSLNANRQVLGYNSTTNQLWIYPPANDTVKLNLAPVVSVNGKVGAVTLTTDSIPEGSINLYFTTQRVRNSLSGGYGVVYSASTGNIAIDTTTIGYKSYYANTFYTKTQSDSNYVKVIGGIITGPIYYGNNPVSNNELVNKNYVDSKVIGLSWKQDVKAATTANIGLSGIITPIDGVTMAAGDRVLVKNQTDSTQNGIYVESSTAWSRSADMNTGANILASAVFVQVGGTVNGGTQWVNTNTGTINIGSTGIFFTQFNGGATYVGINGVNIVGANISLDTIFVHNHFYSNASTGITYSNGLYSLSAIPNSSLANSTISGISLGSTLASLTPGFGLSGSAYNGSTAQPLIVDSTKVTTPNFVKNYYTGSTGISINNSTGAITNTGIITASAGSGISVSGTNPLTISNTGVLNVNGNTGAISMDTTYIPNFFLKVRSELSAGSGVTYNNVTGVISATGTGGTVTNFTSGNLTNFATTSVANATTTPSLTFALTNAPAHSYFGNNTGLSAAPNYYQPDTSDIANFWQKTRSELSAGTGIGYNATTGAISNTGVLSNIAGTGISISGATGNSTITNTGVTSFSAGTTGLTPSTITTGAITLGGILSSTAGGSGVNNAGTLTWGSGGTLGSNAYTSTAYLPLTGGTLTGPLYGTQANFSNNVNLQTGNTSFQWINAGNNVAINGSLGIMHLYTGATSYKLAATIDTSSNLKVNGNITDNGLISAPFVATDGGGTFIPAAYTPYNPASYPVNAGGETLQSVGVRGNTYNGNVGFSDVSTQSWSPNYRAVQIGAYASIWGGSVSGTSDMNFHVSTNLYYNSGGNLVTQQTASQGSALLQEGINGLSYYRFPVQAVGTIVTVGAPVFSFDSTGNVKATTFTANVSSTSGGVTVTGNNTSFTGNDLLISRSGSPNYGAGNAPAIQLYNSSDNTSSIIQSTSAAIQLMSGTPTHGWVERLRIDTLGNIQATNGGYFTGSKFVTSGGTSSEFVKGDGSLDGTAYTPTNGTGATGTWPISVTGNAITWGSQTDSVVSPSNGQILSYNGRVWVNSAAPATGVTSFSAGSTGLTPNTATTGAVTLAGTLAVANGGTGNTSGQAASVANALTLGTDLSGGSYNGSGAVTVNNTSTLATVTGRGATTTTAVTLARTTLTDSLVGVSARFTGTVTASAGYESSDLRLKNLISRKDTINPLLLRMITFHWKPFFSSDTTRTHYGNVAQEVKMIYPDLVSTDGRGYETVNYTELHALQIDQLKKEVDQLKEIVNKQQQEIDELKKLVQK